MQRNIVLSILISGVLISSILLFSSGGSGTTSTVDNVEVKDGVQYVSIDALGGYYPRKSTVDPNIPTKLVVKTNGTYDCSTALVIRSIGYQNSLQPTGEEVIDLGTLESGQKIQGTCSMGMYGFQIESV